MVLAERDHIEGCAEQWEAIANQQREELEELRAELAARPLPDLNELRSLALNSLKLGKQAPSYKAAAKALDRFIQDLKPLAPAPPIKTANGLVTEALKGVEMSDNEQYFTALRQLVKRLKLGHLYKNPTVEPRTYYIECDGERLIENRELSAIADWLRAQPLIEELQK